MRPISEFPVSAAQNLIGVLADIDDTITTDGRLTADAYEAMERLRAAGLIMIPITGRPAGWCDHIARMWPVDGVVGENGAFYFRYEHARRKFHSRFVVPEDEIRAGHDKLMSVASRILRDVPGTAMASDQAYRLTDIAIDFCEDVPPLPKDQVDRIVSIMREEGLTAKVSSIHVNGWLGSYDKLGMTRTMMSECFSIDIEKDRERFVFVGDSPNDQPMFGFFTNAVGVANIRNFDDQLTSEPAFVTAAEGGAGFSELAELIVSARSEATV